MQTTHDFCAFDFDGAINAATPFTYQGINGWALGGSFTTAGGIPASRVTFFTGDNYLPLGAGLPANVNALTTLNGELYAAGSFTPGLARFNASTGTWTNLGTGLPAGSPNLLTFLTNGPDLYAGGTVGGQGTVLKFNPTIDSWGKIGLNINLSGAVNALASFDDGSGSGPAIFAGTTANPRIFKYNPATDAWAMPPAGGISGSSSTGYRVNALVPWQNKLLILGRFPAIGGVTSNGAAFLRNNTYTDFSAGLPSFPSGSQGIKSGALVEGPGLNKIFFSLDTVNTATSLYWTASGTEQPAFTPVPGASVNTAFGILRSLLGDPPGRDGILTINSTSQNNIAGPMHFFDVATGTWSGFGGNGIGGGSGSTVAAFSVAPHFRTLPGDAPQDTLLIGYTGTRAGGQAGRGACAVALNNNSNGRLGFRFLSGCSSTETGFIGTNAIATMPTAGYWRTILGGYFTTFAGSACSNLATIDSGLGCACGPGGFDNGFISSLCPIRVNLQHRFLVGGAYDNAGHIAGLNFLSLYDPDTNTVAPPPGGQANGPIQAMLPIIDPRTGKSSVLMGGSVAQFGATPVNNIFLYCPDTPPTPVSDLFPNGAAPGLAGAVSAFCEPAGALPQAAAGPVFYAGGAFTTTAAGLAVNRVAFWDGTQWRALGPAGNPGVNGFVDALAVWDDGTGPALYIGGAFTAAGSVAANRIVKWNGSQFSPLELNGVNGANNQVYALTVFDAGDEYGPCLYAGGTFTTMMGVSAGRIARIVGRGEPRFIQHPADVQSSQGATVGFTARAAGRPSNAYRWKKGSTLLTDNGRISGAFTRTLTIFGVNSADIASYTCTVTNPFGSAESFAATLTIGCGIADVASLGGAPGADGQLTVDDVILFLQAFFVNNAAIADVASLGGAPTPDGQLTVDDIIAFLNAFFAGCP